MNHEDKLLREQYRRDWPTCELCPVIKRLVGFRCDGQNGVQVHHIWGGGSRWDVVPNLICVCNASHPGWVHQYVRESRIACLAAKVRKGEWDEAVLMECSGQFPSGWLENQIENGGLLEGFTLLAQECLDMIRVGK